MNSITNYLAHVDALIADPLHVARATTGTRVVGYIGDEIPVALIAASGALPLRVRGHAGRATPRADEFMESAFTPEIRSIAERWLQGELDFLHTVVFPRADDSAQRLYYYLCELQRRGRCGGPRPLLYDIARIARPTSIAHSRDSTRRLAEELGARPDHLASAQARVTRRASLIAQLRSHRHAEAPMPGALAWRIEQAAEYDWRETFDLATEAWLLTSPTVARPLRVLLAGDAPPDDSLHRTIEAAGGSMVLELTQSLVDCDTAIVPDLDALADQFQSRRSPVLAMRENPAWVADRAAEVRADAVVFWLIEEDEALPWEISRQMRSLRERRMPTLLLTRQRWLVDEQTQKEVTGFMRQLEVPR